MDSLCETITALFKMYDAANGTPEEAARIAYVAHGNSLGTISELTSTFRKIRDSILLRSVPCNGPETLQKRYRRKASQIERLFNCPAPGCHRKYGSAHALKNHCNLKHDGLDPSEHCRDESDRLSPKPIGSSSSDLESTDAENVEIKQRANFSDARKEIPTFALEHPRMPGPLPAFAPPGFIGNPSFGCFYVPMYNN